MPSQARFELALSSSFSYQDFVGISLVWIMLKGIVTIVDGNYRVEIYNENATLGPWLPAWHAGIEPAALRFQCSALTNWATVVEL